MSKKCQKIAQRVKPKCFSAEYLPLKAANCVKNSAINPAMICKKCIKVITYKIEPDKVLCLPAKKIPLAAKAFQACICIKQKANPNKKVSIRPIFTDERLPLLIAC